MPSRQMLWGVRYPATGREACADVSVEAAENRCGYFNQSVSMPTASMSAAAASDFDGEIIDAA